MIETDLLPNLTDLAAATLAQSLRWTPLLLAALLAARLLGGSPHDRKALWVLSLLALPSLPLMATLAPSLPVPDWRAAVGYEVSSPVSAEQAGVVAEPAAGVAPSPAVEPAGPDLAAAAAMVWLLGLLGLLVREALEHARALALCRGAAPAGDRVRSEAAEAARSLGTGPPDVRLGQVPVPVLCGLLAPVVLLPPSAASWPAARRRAALLHELAHRRAGDPWLELAARLVCAVFWFHPGTWLVHRRLRREMELLADAVAVGADGRVDARDYGRALLDIARDLRGVVPGLAMARPGGLEARLRALVEKRPRPSALRRGSLAALCLAALFAGVALAAGGVAGLGDWLGSREGAFDLRCGDEATCRAAQVRAGELLDAAGHPGVLVVQRVDTGELVAYAARGPAATPRVPPASVAKLAVAALWWEEGFEDVPLPCPETWSGPDGVEVRAVQDRGEIEVPRQMIVYSCTTAAGAMVEKLAGRLGSEALERRLADFGFAPRGSSPWLPSWAPAPRLDAGPGWEARRVDMAASLGRVSTTPLHVASFVQAIGHGGVRLAMRRPGEGASGEERLMGAATAERLRRAMADAVTGGTGRRAHERLEGSPWSLVGKTGTRQRQDEGYDGWFAGLATDDEGQARYAVVAFLDGGGMGSSAAALLAADMTRFLGESGF